jgi:hypothetical protein
MRSGEASRQGSPLRVPVDHFLSHVAFCVYVASSLTVSDSYFDCPGSIRVRADGMSIGRGLRLSFWVDAGYRYGKRADNRPLLSSTCGSDDQPRDRHLA